MLTPAAAAPNTWRPANAPEGGVVTAIAVASDGSRWYAATRSGIYAGTDGRRWQQSPAASAVTAPYGIRRVVAAPDDTAYALGDFGGFLQTSDGGRTWRLAHIDSPFREVEALAVSRAVAYAVTREDEAHTVWRSEDAGRSWTATGETPAGFVRVLVVDPGDDNVLYAGGYFGIAISRDGGATWTPATAGLPARADVSAIALHRSAPRRLFAGTLEHGVFTSSDGGASWSSASEGLAVLPLEWIGELALDADSPEVVHALVHRPGNVPTVAVATSTDAGRSWRTRRVSRFRLTSLVGHPTARGVVLGGSEGQGVLRSDDRGARWRRTNTGLMAVDPAAMAVDPTEPRRVYLATFGGSGLLRTENGGARWSPATARPAPDIRDVVVRRGAPPTTLVATERGVLRSRDGGRTWTSANAGLAADRLAITDLEAGGGPRPAVYAAAGRAGSPIFRTLDGGTSWAAIARSMTPAGAHVRNLAANPRLPRTVYAVVTARRSDRAQVFVSTDAGARWERRGGRVPVNPLDLALTATGDVYVADGSRVYRLRPRATRWQRVATGLPRYSNGAVAQIWALVASPRTGAVYAGTERGLVFLPGPRARRWRSAGRALDGRSVEAVAFAHDGSPAYAAGLGRFFVRR